jgi:hypothetical protein
MKAKANEYGVTWARSQNGKLDIAVRFNGTRSWPLNEWAVWAIFPGTHDVAPVSRNFKLEQEARDYANQLWARR